MPGSADPAILRAILESDRAWSVYALADLAPSFSAYAEWHVARDSSALWLIYNAFDPPVLFAHGSAADLEPLLGEIAGRAQLYLSVRPEVLALLRAGGYRIHHEKTMWRMVLDNGAILPPSSDATLLDSADSEELAQLYAGGDASGEAPPFFHPHMLRDGIYYGVRENGQLMAAAGTHVIAPEQSVAAIGNVYTRRDRRGRGLSRRVTAAVCRGLLSRGLRTVALNVEITNTAAWRVYQSLGFQTHCEYREGIAIR